MTSIASPDVNEKGFNVDHLTDDEIQDAIDRGDLVRHEELEGGYYELTEQGKLRIMCNGLVNVLDTVIQAHKQGRSYRRVIDYVKKIRESIESQ